MPCGNLDRVAETHDLISRHVATPHDSAEGAKLPHQRQYTIRFRASNNCSSHIWDFASFSVFRAAVISSILSTFLPGVSSRTVVDACPSTDVYCRKLFLASFDVVLYFHPLPRRRPAPPNCKLSYKFMCAWQYSLVTEFNLLLGVCVSLL